jgi:hypothetical protein
MVASSLGLTILAFHCPAAGGLSKRKDDISITELLLGPEQILYLLMCVYVDSN